MITTITNEVLDKDNKRDRQGRKITTAARRSEMATRYRANGLTTEQFARREGINRVTLVKRVHLHRRRRSSIAKAIFR